MLNAKFGIEIELTRITREKAAKVAAKFREGEYIEGGTYYDVKKVKVADGRIWEFVYDGSIRTQVSRNGGRVNASRDDSVEIVSPILTYRKDIDTFQEHVRRIRKAGAL